MKEVIDFVVKGIVKSKYILLVPFAMILLIVSLLVINSTQSETTRKELQGTFDNRQETVNFLISRALKKQRHIGLTEEQQQSLDSLLSQEKYLYEISSKLDQGNLDISLENIKYTKEYKAYVGSVSIPYNNMNLLTIEQRKAEMLAEHNLSFTEQQTPFNTALFTKQLFQLLFSPITAFLFLLIFSYKYLSDAENRTFDFFKVNSLSNTAIYYGYLTPFLLIVPLYIFIASFLSLLPTLVTGNINTIHYPIEIAVGSETMMVPVWKWLLFLPIGWGIFVSLLLVLAICLFKQRISLGALLAMIALPLVIGYVISTQFGFYMVNPIHLIVSYETHLLPTHRFMIYLLWMFIVLIICLVASYPVFNSQGSVFKPTSFLSTKKQYHPKNKWKLLQFEHVKKKRKGHVLFTLILLFGIIGGTSIFVNQQYQNLPETSLKLIEDLQNIYVERQSHWKVLEDEEDMERLSTSQEESDEEMTEFIPKENPYTVIVEDMEHGYNVLEGLKKEIGSPHFPEKFRETMNTLDSYKDIDPSQWPVTGIASKEQQRILDEKDITPWTIGHSWISNFDDPSTAFDNEHYKLLKASQERHTKYGNSGLFSVYKYLDWNMMLFVLGVFILLLWTSISEEQRPNLSMNFLTTKPISSSLIYVSKWVYNGMIASGLLLISGSIVFLLSLLIGGLGESQYPILVYAVEKYKDDLFYSAVDNAYFYFESLLALILKSGVLIMAQIFFLNSLFSLIGRWLKNHYATIIITLIITFAGYFLANQYTSINGMYLNPFVYFDTWNIVDGWKSIVADSSKVNFINGCISLLVSGFLLFCMGLLSGRKRV
ncbi:hypothetical protein [Sporosarcina limicola]|uniref:ABC-type transport system involved in multi-copper enzyme maturation permease subunit n=1 Tax=Sporosarcina limicola TaxID=34101 RepID=A0A927MJN1_9BACL|nr:hypothetical protein [Sporosarcina limicola]MBE1555920.1 ABC-type transport system involved in multi-copper enzyme maturation permease subunit [Sporosarcina limicola]